MIYGGTGVDTGNYAYLGYGNDANARFVYGNTSNAVSLQIGRATSYSGGGAFTPELTVNQGNVGIGTTSPVTKLHVASDGNANTKGLFLAPSTYTLGTNGGLNIWYSDAGATNSYIDSRWNSASAALNFRMETDGTPVNAMTILGSGNVGIGQTSPHARLDISSNGGTDGIVIYQQADNTETIQTYIDGHWSDRTTYAGGCCNYLLLQPDVGVVGIGTTSPGYKLDVSGDIRIASTNRLYLGSGPNASIYWDGSELQTPSSFYMAGSTNWVQNTLNVRGPLRNDSAAYLDVEGGTSGYTYFGGNVGIGVTGPGSKLTIAGSSTYGEAFQTGTLFVSNAADNRRGVDIGYDPNYEAGFMQAGKTNVAYEPLFINPSGGNVTIGTTNAQYTLTVNGTAYASGAAGALSDIRHKKNVQSLPDGALTIVEKLRPVTYEWKDPKDSGMKGTEMGFIAQEVEKVMPSMVLTQDDKEKTKGLKYNEFSALIAKAVQELKHIVDGVIADVKKLAARVDEAFTKLAAHDSEIKKLKDENEALRAAVCKLDATATFCHSLKTGKSGHPVSAPPRANNDNLPCADNDNLSSREFRRVVNR